MLPRQGETRRCVVEHHRGSQFLPRCRSMTVLAGNRHFPVWRFLGGSRRREHADDGEAEGEEEPCGTIYLHRRTLPVGSAFTDIRVTSGALRRSPAKTPLPPLLLLPVTPVAWDETMFALQPEPGAAVIVLQTGP